MDLDKDLAARQEARKLCREAREAQIRLAQFSQETLDAIVEAVAKAFSAAAPELAALAVQETGFGNVEDKITKNRFASESVCRRIRGMKTVGVLKEMAQEKLWEVGVPVGVIGAIVPSTNPTSTVCYKALIALKAGNAIVFSPHPKAVTCTLRAAQIVSAAAEKAGAPKGCVGCLSMASMAGCQELMAAPEVRLILATGGPGMVKAAYSSGKPAIGVGAGQQSRVHCTRLAGSKADTWFLRQHPKTLALPFKPELGRPDRDNVIDGYINGNEEDVCAEGIWQNYFTARPAPLTAEEKRLWLDSRRDVALGSDAFFPFADNIKRAYASGVKYIAQPGGSIRDDLVIAECDKKGIAMAFTGMRLFHH